MERILANGRRRARMWVRSVTRSRARQVMWGGIQEPVVGPTKYARLVEDRQVALSADAHAKSKRDMRADHEQPSTSKRRAAESRSFWRGEANDEQQPRTEVAKQAGGRDAHIRSIAPLRHLHRHEQLVLRASESALPAVALEDHMLQSYGLRSALQRSARHALVPATRRELLAGRGGRAAPAFLHEPWSANNNSNSTRRAFTATRAVALDGTDGSNGEAFADFLPVVPPECLRVQTPKLAPQNGRPGPSSFTEMFRMMSPYINFHRGSTMVIHLPGQLVESPVFSAVMQDIALLNTFGIKLVLVAGSRPQLNHQLELRQLSQRFDCGMRITGPEELKCAMDAAGSVRFQIESFLGRGIVNSPGRARTINVASGNFITAQPVGVRGGVDFKNTGEMRRLNTAKVREALDNGDIVLISSIGYSASGEVFNCLSEQVASKCAIQLQSDKLIFMHDGEEMFDTRTNQKVQALIIQQAQQYVELAGANPEISPDFLLYLKQSILACVNGVKRSHLVSRHVDGGLLQELFTRDGEGLMISKHMYEGVRMAKTSDIVSIMRLIQPLLDEDVLVSRNQEQIESNVHTFTVVERDGAIIACAALQPYENNFAEMACVAVDPAYRSSGKGNALLGFILRKARSMGVNKLFVLTTRTSHWFMERGFETASVDDLPPSKRAKIDLKRQSKVYIMDISCKRALDEKELLLQLS